MATIPEKLQMKPGQRLALLNAPAETYEKLDREISGISVSSDPAAISDSVILFVTSLAEAQHSFIELTRTIRPGCVVWVAYPKGGSGVPSDVSRDKLWPMLELLGWKPARQIALDEVWTAMRFGPAKTAAK